jgi:CheY-like chemotaxis protein
MAKLLVVDDEKDSRESLRRYLENEGHSVQCYGDGKQALHAILEEAPDLIILDLLMPELDGIGFLEVIRAYLRLQALPVIVLTGLPESPLVDRIRSLKVNTILVKGKVSPEEIAEAVTQELHRVPG